MKRLFVIVYKRGSESLALLQAAVDARNIELVPVVVEDFDFTRVPEIAPGDGLYRVATGGAACRVEQLLLNPGVVSLYTDPMVGIGKLDNVVACSVVHQQAGLPIIPTVFDLPQDRTQLQNAVDALGGFPIIIKAMGGSHGVGVMKLDSMDSLSSVADYLSGTDDAFIMRQYLHYTAHARLIVLGDRVISSIEYKKVPGDFRSNVGTTLQVLPKDFGSEINQLAVESVRVLRYEFGGVDILIDADGQPYIAEVNFPCFFPRAQHITGHDIAGEMVAYLQQKSATVASQ